MVVQSSHAVTQSPEPVPGPELGDVKPEFTVVAPQDITVERAEELRQQQGENAVALIFDVSPGGVNREQLGEQLRENPRVVICDHHGACAPLREIPGQELCAAEVIVRDLPRLYRAGALTSSNSEPVKLLCITNTMNVDPDCVISKFLIDSYIDPELRQEIWGDPETLNLLVEAARFGDNKFFGGLDPREVNYGTISPSQKLALTVFQMINELKADLVIGTLLDRALLNANHSVLTKRRAARLAVEEYAPEDIADICARERHEDLRGILSLAGKPGEDSLFRFRENYWQFLREQLGEELITLTKLVEQFGGDARPIGEKFIGSRNDAEVHDRWRSFVLYNLSREDIRSAFVGKEPSLIDPDGYSPPLNDHSIRSLLQDIASFIPDILRTPENHKHRVDQFGTDLRYVSDQSAAHSKVIEEKIGVTTPPERLDYDPNKPQQFQRIFVKDWLREAAGAFTEERLHIMDRGGHLTVSSRYEREGDQKLVIDLRVPEMLDAFRAEEERLANERGENPAILLVKANLILPVGGVNHYSKEFAVEQLLKYYDQIVRERTTADLTRDESTEALDGCGHLIEHLAGGELDYSSC